MTLRTLATLAALALPLSAQTTWSSTVLPNPPGGQNSGFLIAGYHEVGVLLPPGQVMLSAVFIGVGSPSYHACLCVSLGTQPPIGDPGTILGSGLPEPFVAIPNTTSGSVFYRDVSCPPSWSIPLVVAHIPTEFFVQAVALVPGGYPGMWASHALQVRRKDILEQERKAQAKRDADQAVLAELAQSREKGPK